MAAFAAGSLMLFAPGHADARIFGVLAAASRTEVLQRPILEGAPNDILAMQQALLARGAAEGDILRLLDGGGEGLEAASRAGILTALAAAAAQAGEGDQVVVYLSGHGGQAVDGDALSEADGLDEIFLAFGREALSDDDIGLALDRIRATGADVLFIGDFCHSGDSVRGGEPAPRTQLVLTAEGARETGAVRGRLTAIYAAPANRAALQSVGPVWAAEADQRVQSVLTMYAAAALADAGVVTYRDLRNRIVTGVSAHGEAFPWLRRNLAPPQFEGDLDALVLAPRRSAALDGPWPVRFEPGAQEITLGYGALDGLAEGDVLSLWQDDPAGEGRALVLYGRVVLAGPAHVRVAPASADGALLDRWPDARDRHGGPLDYAATLMARRMQPFAGPLDTRAVLHRVANQTADAASVEIAAGLKLDLASWAPPGGCGGGLALAADGGLPPGASGWRASVGSGADGLELAGCHVVFAKLTNGSGRPADVTFLVLEPSGQIEPLAGAPAVLGGRVPPGASLTGAYAFDAATEGFDAELAVIAASPGALADQIVSYSHLCAPAPGSITSCEGARDERLRGGAHVARGEVSGSVVLLRGLPVAPGGQEGSKPE